MEIKDKFLSINIELKQGDISKEIIEAIPVKVWSKRSIYTKELIQDGRTEEIENHLGNMIGKFITFLFLKKEEIIDNIYNGGRRI